MIILFFSVYICAFFFLFFFCFVLNVAYWWLNFLIVVEFPPLPRSAPPPLPPSRPPVPPRGASQTVQSVHSVQTVQQHQASIHLLTEDWQESYSSSAYGWFPASICFVYVFTVRYEPTSVKYFCLSHHNRI